MDWTSIFVEDGSEDLIIPQLMNRKQTTSRLTRLVSRVYHHHERMGEEENLSGGHRLLDLPEGEKAATSYSLRAVYYLSINYILGVGSLGIPFAFARAGFLLCSLILSTVTVFSYFTVMWVAETGARFEIEIRKNTTESTTEETSLVDHPSNHTVEDLRYEVIDLVQFYLGRFQKLIYQMSLMALMYIGLLAYTQVFCGAIAAVFPSHGDFTGLPQLIFGLMVVPLSCMDLEEQLAMQSLMAAVRFVAIAVVVFGSLFALFIDQSNSTRESPPFFAPADESSCDMSYTVCFRGFGVAFSTCMFSQLFQHSIPGLLRPLNDQPEQLRKAPVSERGSFFTFHCKD
jgi:amino acid permease